jgi:hypothetical protein
MRAELDEGRTELFQLEDFACVLVDGESGRLLHVHLLSEDAI